MVEIKAGPELDKAIADAVGAKHRGNAMVGERYGPVYELNGKSFSRPSEDLNAAVAAALASAKDFYGCVELPPCITIDNRTGWKCTIEDSPEGRGKTPALAICAAILKLKEQQ